MSSINNTLSILVSGLIKKGTDSVNEAMFLSENPTDRQKRTAALLVELFNKHKASPEIITPGTLDRSSVDFDTITRSDLENAGFLPSLVAVPERGQDAWTTYRHPLNGLHFHRHTNKWLFHDDTYASMQMLIRKYKLQHPNASRMDVLKFTLKNALPKSFNHIVHEGGPGYVNWMQNTILGKPGFIEGETALPSPSRAAKGIAATALAGMAGSRLLTGKWNPITSLGTVGGFVTSSLLADQLSNMFKHNKKFDAPGWANTSLRVGIPLLGTTMAWLQSRKLQKKVNEIMEGEKAPAKAKRKRSTRATSKKPVKKPVKDPRPQPVQQPVPVMVNRPVKTTRPAPVPQFEPGFVPAM